MSGFIIGMNIKTFWLVFLDFGVFFVLDYGNGNVFHLHSSKNWAF